MKLLGLTGGVGMGKSAAADLLRQHGIPVVDTDILARKLVEPGQTAIAEIQGVFGSEMIAEDGSLRRDALARHIFQDPGARQKLEAILHPRIRSAWKCQVEIWRQEGHRYSVVVIPLLFETGAQAEFDSTICVACSPATQRQRLSQRGWPPTEINQRIAAQLPIDQKIGASDFVIWTEGGMDVHATQLERILAQL